MFVTPKRKVYYSGDSGYGPHFKAIGEQFGGVDLAIMENGQYDQTGSTSICIRRKRRRPRQISMPAVVPGHNGRFVLAKHTGTIH